MLLRPMLNGETNEAPCATYACLVDVRSCRLLFVCRPVVRCFVLRLRCVAFALLVALLEVCALGDLYGAKSWKWSSH